MHTLRNVCVHTHVHVHVRTALSPSRGWGTLCVTTILIKIVLKHVRDVCDISVTFFVAHTVPEQYWKAMNIIKTNHFSEI